MKWEAERRKYHKEEKMKRSKRYAEIAKSYDKHELVDVATAVKQIKSFDNAKFDETVEMHFRLGVDGRSEEHTSELQSRI